MHQETLVAREPNTACAVTVQVARWIGMPAGIENLTCRRPRARFDIGRGVWRPRSGFAYNSLTGWRDGTA